MKQSILFIAVICLFSCITNEKTENELITKFESSLGKPETKYLNEMVSDFDAFLESRYDDKNSASNLKLYLKELSDNNSRQWKADTEKHQKYLASNLFAKYDTIYPDSVWIEDDLVNVKFEELEVIQSIIPLDNENLESLVNELKEEPELNIISRGNFYNALKALAFKDSLISNYLSYVEIAGHTPIYLLANGLLYDYKAESEYFAKRILIMEMND